MILFLLATASPTLKATPQTFAVALPELDGPVTMGVFDPDGKRVRLLCRDAPVESLPAGLNGLIMTWDGKDGDGVPVPPGRYSARGLVHGVIVVGALPFSEVTPVREWAAGMLPEAFSLSGSSLTLRAASDSLLPGRPFVTLAVAGGSGAMVLEADGLPVADLPLPAPEGNFRLLRHGSRAGEVLVTSGGDRVSRTVAVSGLERIVPLNAGWLEVAPDASHAGPLAGESAP